MLKISDILKKNKGKRESKKTLSEQKTNVQGVQGKSSGEIKAPREIKQKNTSNPGTAESEPSLILPENSDNREAVNIYNDAISLSKEMGTLSSENWESFQKRANIIIDKFIAILGDNENQLLELFFSDYDSPKGYLYQHSVNVCILSIYISQSLRYNRDKIRQFAMAALMHDIGLINYDNLISQNRRFTQDDYAEVKKHPIDGRNFLEKINSSVEPEIIQAVTQEHERLDGSGYPNALEADDICETARLVGIADSYESMMHARPYRDKFKSADVIKFFTQQKTRFEHKFLKALIDLIGIFPVMTPVRLNTREMGVVIRQNYQMPLKPVVKITHSAQGQKADIQKAVDLTRNFSIYIQEGLISHKIKDEKKSE